MQSTPYRRGTSPELAVWLRESAPDNAEQHRFLLRSLRRAIREELTDRQRMIVTLYYDEGRNLSEIADLLGIHKSTACRTLHRAQDRLRHVLSYSLEFPIQ